MSGGYDKKTSLSYKVATIKSWNDWKKTEPYTGNRLLVRNGNVIDKH